MQVVRTVNEWQLLQKRIPHNAAVGFVPTMGSLHQGHAALIQKSLDENDITVVSIFVNKLQFDQSNDYI